MPEEKTAPVVSTRDLAFAGMVRQLEMDPKYRPLVHAMVADKFPEAAAGEFPDVEVRRAVAPALKAVKDAQDALDKRLNDEKAAKDYGAWRASLVTAGIAEKDLDAVEKIARERNNADPDALALYWRSQQQPATPTTRGFGVQIPGRNKAGGEWFDNDGQGGPGIMQDRQAWTLNRASQVYDEVMTGRR